jgi:probable addiction module antidote protein
MAVRVTRWDAADALEIKEDIAAYLDAILEDGDPDLLKAALGDVARSKGMTELARSARLGRANLYDCFTLRHRPAPVWPSPTAAAQATAALSPPSRTRDCRWAKAPCMRFVRVIFRPCIQVSSCARSS